MASSMLTDFYMRLAAARKQAKLTQEELARQLGVDRVTINRYETGKVPLTVEMLDKIASLLDMPLGWFFGESPAPTPPPPPHQPQMPKNTPVQFQKRGARKGLVYAEDYSPSLGAALARIEEAEQALAAARAELERLK